MEAERMNEVLWIVAKAATLALASFTVSYGVAAFFIGRQNRKRGAHLRGRLRA